MSNDIDPLSAMLSSSSSSASAAVADAWKKPTSADQGGEAETLSAVDFSKVKLKETKKKQETPVVVENTSKDPSSIDNRDRFGLGVDLFGNLNKSRVKKGDLFDEMETEVDNNNNSSNNVFLKAQQDIADAEKNDLLHGMKKSKKDILNPNSKEEMRVAYEKEDDKLNDLKVTSLLQEEDLDFDMFGKATGKLRKGHEERAELKKGTAGISTVKTGDFDITNGKLTDEYLASMNQATSGKDLSTRQVASSISDTGYKQPTTTTKASTDAAAALDLNSLDLNSYISQQSESSKGGLFD